MRRVIYHIMKKELLQTFRDRRMTLVIFIAPIIQLIIFGFAATFEVKNIKLAILDRDQSLPSRQLVEKFTSSDYFRLIGYLHRNSEIDHFLDSGKADAVMVIPPNYHRDLNRGDTVHIQFLIDGTNSNTATIIENYLELIIGTTNLELIDRRKTNLALSSLSSGILPDQLTLALHPKMGLILPEYRIWYNEKLRASDFMVPAVFAMILLVITVFLTSVGLTREREIGTYEQLIVSPVRPEILILGKTLPFALVGLAEVIFILISAWLIFGVTLKGSYFLFFGATLIFLITTLSLGIFISSLSRTMQQAMMTTFFFMFPMVILSGLMFPIANMPAIFQWLTLLNPLRYYIEIVRGVFLKEANLGFVAPRAVVLLSIGLLLMSIASYRFTKKLF